MSDGKYAEDIAFVQALTELLKASDMGEIQVERRMSEEDWIDVRVSRQSATVVQAAPASFAPAPAPAAPSAPNPAASPAPAADTGGDPAQEPGAVTSPMVGTAYLQAEPGAPAFVRVGDQVSEGQTVLIIEAMKTMNQIPAPHAGTVKRILVEDGTPVEFGSPLLIIA
ncbi:MAG: acetyl-CoA carboxylase biotin carboxyl carrier protein [Pseudomonadota bacterium]